ncbi:uncharacterized protein F5891DRAFT_1258641 [Suillus fuscotomentosus]|uniref:Uncharacterized protein n=1 Tax=Suillus fuscotomentosus TaxID=1912939 RepID=A0AAD4HEF2_9AGAM|nr:uncharacterized protein F5891DRAFT_1258641 [Suillus fuscotomentosus]KAG1893578.1 hypothetical protein F5891DRAFT_1258641 [Suillus fuscotomentosus]
MPGSSESRFISGKNLQVPSWRIPAGIYVSINVDSRRRWKSAISVLSSDESVAWGDTVTLPSNASPALSIEISASYKLGRVLGGGEVIGKLQLSWDELLDHGDHPFDLSFRAVRGVKHSITLKVAVVHACDDKNGTLFDTVKLLETQMLATYDFLDTKSTDVDICEAVQLYHELLPLCPEGTYLRSIAVGENGVDYVIGGCNNLPIDGSDEDMHLRRVVLQLCPLGHRLRPRILDELARAVKARFDQHGNIDDLDMSIQLRREAVSLSPEGHAGRDTYLNNLAVSLVFRSQHQGNPNDLNEAISL